MRVSSRRISAWAAVAVMSMLLVVPAQAIILNLPVAIDLVEDGISYNMNTTIDVDAVDLGNGLLDYNLAAPVDLTMGNGEVITITQLEGLTDPIQTLGFGVVDTGAASQFWMAIEVPVLPNLSGPATWSASLFGSMTDGGTDGVGVSPWLSSGLAQFSVNNYANVIGNLGTAHSLASPGGLLPSFSGSGMFNLPPNTNSLETLVSFNGTGGNDAYGMTTVLNVTPVPEPGSLFALGMGITSMAFAARRRKRS